MAKIEASTTELVLKYIEVLKNFYAVITMRRVYRIIAQQNPELGLTKDMFEQIVNEIDFDGRFCLVLHESELLEEEYPQSKDFFDKILVADYLYIVDGDAYPEMKKTQENLRFYLPEREELLRYINREYMLFLPKNEKLSDHIKSEFKYSDEIIHEILEHFAISWVSDTEDYTDMEYAVETWNGFKYKEKLKFSNAAQEKKFYDMLFEVYNDTRLPKYRGLTPNEANRPQYE